jgi:hopanoid C-3 methylase
VKRLRPSPYVFVGGHSVSFIAKHVLEQADGAIDAVLRGEGEVAAPLLLAALPDRAVHEIPGAVTLTGTAPGAPGMLTSIDAPLPARDLLRRRRRYFTGVSTRLSTTRSPPALHPRAGIARTRIGICRRG